MLHLLVGVLAAVNVSNEERLTFTSGCLPSMTLPRCTGVSRKRKQSLSPSKMNYLTYYLSLLFQHNIVRGSRLDYSTIICESSEVFGVCKLSKNEEWSSLLKINPHSKIEKNQLDTAL